MKAMFSRPLSRPFSRPQGDDQAHPVAHPVAGRAPVEERDDSLEADGRPTFTLVRNR